MKKTFLLLFSPILAFAFSLVLNSGKEGGVAYSILHLKNDSEFGCGEEILAYDNKIYVCEIKDRAIPKIDDKILSLVEINFTQDLNSTKITIVPRANSRLIAYQEPLFKTDSVIMVDQNLSKHYSIIIDPLFSEFDKTKKDGINFAPTFKDMKYPSVGALDLNKAPIENPDGHDINSYLSIKKEYESKHYDYVISSSESALRKHQNSIFTNEFMLYRLRALDKIFDTKDSHENLSPANMVDEGRAWMKLFASDENYPEVLYLVMKSYLKQDMTSDANYILDILMNEHKDSSWTKSAILEFADRIYNTGKRQDAIRMYEDVLYSSNNIDVASRASLSLVNSSIDDSQFEIAKGYMLKILNANPNYLLNYISKSMDLAGIFRDKNINDVASKIYEILVLNLKKSDDRYEIALKNLGLSLVAAKEVEKAYKYLQKYQKEFKEGGYVAQIDQGMDRLFFELNEANSTKLHQHYDLLMDKYGKNDIGQKALKEQVALYLKERKFNDVLRYADAVRDVNDTDNNKNLNLAALALANDMIRKDDCKAVVNLVEGYEIRADIEAKFKLFSCFMRMSRHQSAYELARANITSPDMLDRVEWLVNLSSVLLTMQKYKDVVRVADEALAIAANEEYADVSPVFFDRFDALIKLDRIPDAMATIKAIEDLRENDFRIIEVYAKMSEITQKNKDFLNTVIYAKKAIDMQKRLNINTFSPKVEFDYINALNRLDRLDEALNNLKSILETKLEPVDRVRALAQISEIYIKQKRPQDAKPYLEECVGLNFESSWKSLCSEQIKLVE